ncbi:MAG: cysteine--tRNA ligase [Bacteroidales bacterium]|nr:cysteine--tRNA ligase [Bacteroidales bacterium]
MRNLYLSNTLTKNKELFKPVNEGHVGMYVCGPTVYGDAHLGHARPGVTYDVLFKLLRHLGYKVRYVRNITDVGHLEHDADEGEDKISKKARLEQLEPMEVVQNYTFRYHEAMRLLNVAPPSIEPRASGHIIEQIETIKKILEAGYAYISNGSVYFDVQKYNEKHHYGVLSGRNLDDTLEGTRTLDGQGDKRAPYDFALWKKAEPEHIMHWPSPWSEGFPGWHLECSVMGEKYLGEEFDIHGGGMDLMFPHHECEIAQNVAWRGTRGVKYWVHNNMITINGQKMGKSLGNFITLPELFSGNHPKLEQAYTPMTVRFFILQAHYRGTLDFSNEALQASEKALKRVMQAYKDLLVMAKTVGVPVEPAVLPYGELSDSVAPDSCPADSPEIKAIFDGVYDALCDDLNTPVALSHIFEAVRIINSAKSGSSTASTSSATAGTGKQLTRGDIETLVQLFDDIVFGVLGLRDESSAESGKGQEVVSGLMDMVLEERAKAKAAKDWATSDAIRDHLKALGITVKDTKDGAEWTVG